MSIDNEVWAKWQDNLSSHTKQYLKQQYPSYDRDLIVSSLMGIVIGFILGVLI